MSQTTAYLVGIVIIALGLRIAAKGYAVKSKARMLLGAAAVPAGVAIFFMKKSPIVTALLVLGVAMYVASLVLLRKEVAARRAQMGNRPQQGPRGQRRRRR